MKTSKKLISLMTAMSVVMGAGSRDKMLPHVGGLLKPALVALALANQAGAGASSLRGAVPGGFNVSGLPDASRVMPSELLNATYSGDPRQLSGGWQGVLRNSDGQGQRVTSMAVPGLFEDADRGVLGCSPTFGSPWEMTSAQVKEVLALFRKSGGIEREINCTHGIEFHVHGLSIQVVYDSPSKLTDGQLADIKNRVGEYIQGLEDARLSREAENAHRIWLANTSLGALGVFVCVHCASCCHESYRESCTNDV